MSGAPAPTTLRQAAQALLDDVADHGLSWDEDMTGCRFCDRLDERHESTCPFLVLQTRLADEPRREAQLLARLRAYEVVAAGRPAIRFAGSAEELLALLDGPA